MTTIKDYLRDIVIDTQTKLNEKYFPEEDEEKAPEEVVTYELSEDEIEEIVDEYIDYIAKRIVGAEY